jgi:hypothetical protein
MSASLTNSANAFPTPVAGTLSALGRGLGEVRPFPASGTFTNGGRRNIKPL